MSEYSIHDTSIFSVPPTVRSCLESPTLSGNDNDVILSPLGTDKDSDNTEKSISQAKDMGSEDSKEKNFFPVTWRVIGGGVLIGGKRTENLGGEKQCGVESPEEPTSPQEPLIESSDGVGDVVTEGKSCMAAPRPRSGSASTPPIARPRTVIGIRRCKDDVSAFVVDVCIRLTWPTLVVSCGITLNPQIPGMKFILTILSNCFRPR